MKIIYVGFSKTSNFSKKYVLYEINEENIYINW